MEGAGGDAVAQAEVAEAVGELARRLAGEGDREDMPRLEVVVGGSVGDAARQDAGLARAGAREDAQRLRGRRDGPRLSLVQAAEAALGHPSGRPYRWGVPVTMMLEG